MDHIGQYLILIETKTRKILVVKENALNVKKEEVKTLTLIEEDLVPEDVEGVDEIIQEKEDCIILFQGVHIPMKNDKT